MPGTFDMVGQMSIIVALAQVGSYVWFVVYITCIRMVCNGALEATG